MTPEQLKEISRICPRWRDRPLAEIVAAVERVRESNIRDAPPQPMVQADPEGKWDGAEDWMPLAWKLCADEHGEEACTELVWEGGPVPEPWGDRWLKYEDEAKRLIALVRKYAAPQPAASLVAVEPTDAQVALLDPWMRPASARELLRQVLELSTSPPPAPQAAQALDVGAAGFTLTRSILYKCPALKLPQEWWQKLGDMSQIVPLRGVTDEMAAEIVRRLNAAPTPAPAVTPQAVQQPLTDDQIDSLRQQDNGALNFVTLRQFRVVARA